MPFDPNPTETKPDVFSLEGLRDWLESEIAAGRGARTYDYMSISDCLICRFTGERWFCNAWNAIGRSILISTAAYGPAPELENLHTYQAAHDRTVALIEEARR